MPKVSARNLTSKPFLVLAKVRRSCSHLVKTLFFFSVLCLSYSFFDEFLVFLIPLQRHISLAFGSKYSKTKSSLDLVTPV